MVQNKFKDEITANFRMETTKHNIPSFLPQNPQYCPRDILDQKAQIPTLWVGITTQVKSVELGDLWHTSELTTDYDVTYHMAIRLQSISFLNWGSDNFKFYWTLYK